MVEQVSRNKSLNIPKKIDIIVKNTNSIADELEVKKQISKANNKKVNEKLIIEKLKEQDKDFEHIDKIPTNSNDLMVVTVVKKLGAYVITITEKSPKKFRGVFVNRMQNYCLDTLEYLLNANLLRLDSEKNKIQRENYQKEAIVKLKMLGYISMVAMDLGCILMKQYKQITIQLAEAINLIITWKKSDDRRFKK